MPGLDLEMPGLDLEMPGLDLEMPGLDLEMPGLDLEPIRVAQVEQSRTLAGAPVQTRRWNVRDLGARLLCQSAARIFTLRSTSRGLTLE